MSRYVVVKYKDRDGFGQEYGRFKCAVEDMVKEIGLADNLFPEDAKLICKALNNYEDSTNTEKELIRNARLDTTRHHETRK